MSEFEKALSTVFSVGTLQQMLRSATPVALAAIGGSMTEHAGIMNIGMDGMILMGAFFAVLGSFLAQSAFAGVALTLGVGLLVGLFFGLLVVRYRSFPGGGRILPPRHTRGQRRGRACRRAGGPGLWLRSDLG